MRHREQATYWRKYQVDVHALDQIDTEGKAYVLGFVAADGYVDTEKVGFTLHKRDTDILEQIRMVLGSTHPLRIADRDRVALDISSKVLAKRLIELGLFPGKTETVRPPAGIPDQLWPHWLRGYWDGDGWLTKRKRATGITPVLGIAGWSVAMMEFIRQLCSRYTESDVVLGAYKGGWGIRVESDRARLLIGRVYLVGTIGGQRKRRKAEELYALPSLSLANAQQERRRREYQERYAKRNDEMIRLKDSGWRNKDIAAHFGLSPSFTSMICNRKGKRHEGAD